MKRYHKTPSHYPSHFSTNSPRNYHSFCLYHTLHGATIGVISAFLVVGLLTLAVLLINLFIVYKKKDVGKETYRLSSCTSDQPSIKSRLQVFSELQISTNNFDENRVIERGGFDKVYRGELTDGRKMGESSLRIFKKAPSRVIFMDLLVHLYLGNKGSILDIEVFIEQRLDIGVVNPHFLRKVVETAKKCVVDRGVDRPSVKDILWDLKEALRLQEVAFPYLPTRDSSDKIAELAH
ncbi:receptor-like protein kinase HERK 1 [Vicia villosa]|uniref:receptor-like protein kinase HERK 1 n=1 Tax=Vicia villosa TaxID=3911 RepID=UPI00273C62AF|nr:receptor-like protein kinase HERK 1 [Vicia villosa]